MQGQSPSGLSAVPSLSWGSHLSQFFETGEDLRNVLVPFFKAGLDHNESCLWVTGAPFPAEQARAALGAAVPDLAARERRGQIEIRDFSDWYEAGRPLKPAEIVADLVRREREALEKGYQGLRTHGNCSWVGPAQWADFQTYESQVQAAMRGRRMICMCGYCTSTTPGSSVLEVLARHNAVLMRDNSLLQIGQTSESAVAALADSAAIMAKEMRHRLNNTLATVQALMRATTRHSATLDEFQRSFAGRLEALSKTHDILSGETAPSLSLRALFRNELAMFDSATTPRVTLAGDDVILPDHIAVPLGMAIHELATNAAKYGAFSVSAGTLSVRWEKSPLGIVIHWCERNVPAVPPVARTGFGTRLLTELLPRQIDASIDLRFEPEGLEAELKIPV